MPYILHIPGSASLPLRWTVHDPRSSYGNGVLLDKRGRPSILGADILDGATFRTLRDTRGAWIETDRPDRVRSALALMDGESLGQPNI